MYIIIHKMGNDNYYHIASTLEVANKVGADICMDLMNDLEEEHDWLHDQMEGCYYSKRYEDVIALWEYFADLKESTERIDEAKGEYVDRVYVTLGDYHKE